jgi:hypothetical protein
MELLLEEKPLLEQTRTLTKTGLKVNDFGMYVNVGQRKQVVENVVKQPLKITVFSIMKSKYYTEENDALIVYNLLKQGLEQKRKIVISFEGMDGDPYLYYDTICRLYQHFPVDTVNNDVIATGLSAGGEYMMERAKKGSIMAIYDKPGLKMLSKYYHELLDDVEDYRNCTSYDPNEDPLL